MPLERNKISIIETIKVGKNALVQVEVVYVYKDEKQNGIFKDCPAGYYLRFLPITTSKGDRLAINEGGFTSNNDSIEYIKLLFVSEVYTQDSFNEAVEIGKSLVPKTTQEYASGSLIGSVFNFSHINGIRDLYPVKEVEEKQEAKKQDEE